MRGGESLIGRAVRLAGTLLLGLGGALVASRVDIPLAWMIGPMIVVTVACTADAPVYVPEPLRNVMIMVLGVLLGSAFTPAIVESAGRWVPSLASLFVYNLTVTACLFVYFRRVGRFDVETAYFSSVPGGISYMVILGRAYGGDDRYIALVHAARVFLVVGAVPLWFSLTGGFERSPAVVPGAALADLEAQEIAILVASAVLGAWAGRLIRLPTPQLLGPLALSAVLHATGAIEAGPPAILISLALLVIGASIGTRFTGVGLRLLGRIFVLGLGSTIVMLAVSVAFALALAGVTGFAFDILFLAFVPGGLAEMSLIALALGLDPAFVSSHHVVRITLMIFLSPVFYRMFARLAKGRSGRPTAP